MKPAIPVVALGMSFVLVGRVIAAITPEQAALLPAPARHTVGFSEEIKPLLEASCIKCHGRGKAKGGFSLENRETLIKGGDSGPAIIPGKSAVSRLIELVAGIDPENVMPEKGTRLKPEQVGLLRAWIDQGAPWDASVNFAKLPPVNLFPRQPDLPPARRGVTNPIDRLLEPYFEATSFKPPRPVTDRVFARRAYLDVIGLLPTPEEIEAFVSDRRPDKRARLADRLLADRRGYAEHWLTFWNDALRNDYKGTGYIDGGRKQITGWLYDALATNMPFDQFVRELVNPTPESEGFAKGFVWRGTVNASQTPPLQAAQHISQVFMGVNLKCASCHDSFINDWSLADAYGLASVYADKPLEMVQCDKPLGEVAKMKFIYPELGGIDATAPKPERLKQLAEVITRGQNARLTRTIVNRLWAKLLGRGLIEPTDEMDNPAWNQDLLDWLAADLADHGYDLRRTFSLILISQAYQLPAVAATEQAGNEFVFRGPVVRRMSAEQFLDALSMVTGAWNETPVAQVDFSVADPGLAERIVEPKWIWTDVAAAQKTEATTIYWRKEIHLAGEPVETAVVIACDNSFRLFVNGVQAGRGTDYQRPSLIDLKSHLKKGRNVLAIEAVNSSGRRGDGEAEPPNPAGLILYARVRSAVGATIATAESAMDFASDKSWLWSSERRQGWERPDFATTDWAPAVELGGLEMEPWRLAKAFTTALSAAAVHGEVRAALVNNNPLMIALGRPNREQVVTSRPSAATTLQALEMTNGQTLAGLLKSGAEKFIEASARSPREIVVALYQRALSRGPTRVELRTAEELVGAPAEVEGVQDLLWAIAMLPEFQLIH